MKKAILILVMLFSFHQCFCWGFYGHQKINSYAIFLLPPEMMVFFKPNLPFISEHAVDPDKRRYAVADEGPRHYIDIDHYGTYPYESLPRNYRDAVAKYGEDTVIANGIVPWHVQTILYRLTDAFREKDYAKILKNSAEIGHYIADAHVPLHASGNHDGQLTGQKGIHGFWESRLPELLAESDWDFMIGKAAYIENPGKYIWDRVLESGAASDTVLRYERELSSEMKDDQKYSFETRNGVVIRQYSSAFARAFDKKLNGMVERRMRLSIFSIASFWYTAWVNAGQPDLKGLANRKLSAAELQEFEQLNTQWQQSSRMIGRQE